MFFMQPQAGGAGQQAAQGVPPVAPAFPGINPMTLPLAGPIPRRDGATMPVPNTSRAPKFDSQNPSQIPIFFASVDLLAADAGLSQKDRISWARAYAPTEQSLWTTFPEVQGDDYQAFVARVLRLYPGATDMFTSRDLEALIQKQSSLPMSSEQELGEYYRQFLRISSYLLQRNALSPNQVGERFLMGLPKSIRLEVVRALYVLDPNREEGLAWDMNQIHETTRKVVRRTHPSVLFWDSPTGSNGSGWGFDFGLGASSTTNVVAPTPKVADAVKREEMAALRQQVSALTASINEMKQSKGQAAQEGQTSRNENTGNNQRGNRRNNSFNDDSCYACRQEPPHRVSDCPHVDILRNKRLLGRDPATNALRIGVNNASLAPIPGNRNASLIDKMNYYFSIHPDLVPEGASVPYIVDPNLTRNMPNRSTQSMNLLDIAMGPSATIEEVSDSSSHAEASYLSGLRSGKTIRQASPPPQADRSRAKEKGKRRESSPPRADSPPPSPQEESPTLPFVAPAAPKPLPRNEVSDSSKEGPQYARRTPVASMGQTKAVFEMMLDQKLSLPLRSVLGMSKDIQGMMKELVTSRRINLSDSLPAADGQSGDVVQASFYSYGPRPHSPPPPEESPEPVAVQTAALRAIFVFLDDLAEPSEALLDGGCSFVALSSRLWRKLGSPRIEDKTIWFEDASGRRTQSEGLVPRLRLTMSGFTLLLQAHVCPNASYDLLLGQPFFLHTKAQVLHNEEDNSVDLALVHPSTGTVAVFPTHERGKGVGHRRP